MSGLTRIDIDIYVCNYIYIKYYSIYYPQIEKTWKTTIRKNNKKENGKEGKRNKAFLHLPQNILIIITFGQIFCAPMRQKMCP